MTTALDDYIKQIVDKAPPLSPAQRDKLAVLLRGDARGGSAGVLAPVPRVSLRKHHTARAAVYWHYDAADVLLYVGLANDPAARARQHRRHSPWFDFTDRTECRWYATREKASAAELAAIASDKPLFNTQHNETPEQRRRAVDYLVQHNALHLLRPS